MKLKSILSKRNTVVIFVIAIIFFLCGGGKIIGNTISNAVHYFENIFLKEEVKQISFESDNYTATTAGEYKIEKSADWIDKNTAQIEFTVNSNVKTNGKKRDVVIAIDTSGSMQGEKYEAVKKDTTELITRLLEDKNNTVSIIAFSSEAEIKIEQSNNLDELLEIVNNLTIVGGTNYYQALYQAEQILNNYEEKTDRECVVIFLTDGFPTTNNHNQIAEFEVLDGKFPNVTIYGIQYEMGIEITDQLKEVTHKQYSINMEELKNVLFDAAFEPYRYEKFELTDYINTEYFYVESAKDLETSIGSASLVNEDGKQKVVWNLSENEYITGTTAKLKIKIKLKDEYISKDGFYPTNEKVEVKASLDGTDKSVETEKTPQLKHGYTTTYDMNEPEGCNLKDLDEEIHYAFENVELSTEKPICKGYTFQGWETTAKIKYVNSDYYKMPTEDITFKAVWSSLDISKSIEGTVYEKQTLYNVMKKDAELGLVATEYTGLDSEKYENKVYYYNGAVTNNNVLFANYCWKMVRTTDTGGVKLIFSGLPTNGACTNTGADTFLTTGKYNSNTNSLGYFGYMYNTLYVHKYKNMTSAKAVTTLEQKTMNNTNYLYSTSVTDTGTSFILDNPTPIAWNDNYSNLKGYYTCLSATASTCTNVRYISGTEEKNGYLLSLTSGKTFDENNNIVVSKSIKDNKNGTFTLVEPTTITKSDWYANYEKNIKYYLCSDHTSTTCSDMRFITTTTNKNYSYVTPTVFGNSFEYDEETSTYTLVNTKVVADWETDYTNMSNHHYTCLSTTEKCTSINYVYFNNNVLIYYQVLKDGKSIEDAINEMLWDENVNTTDSTIKTTIDNWYANNMTDYTMYLEDTIYCNDRRVSSLNGWSPTGDTTDKITFYSNTYKDLTCPNKNDQFTVSEENGNGKLTYPVGLLTAGETDLAGYDVLGVDNYYWTLSPSLFSSHSNYHYTMSSYVELGLDNIPTNYTSIGVGVRPVISLKTGIGYIAGDGTATNPYVINSRSLE